MARTLILYPTVDGHTLGICRRLERRLAEAGQARSAHHTCVCRFLATIPWQPALVGVFAGRIDHARYGPFDRGMIRLIVWITHGSTDPRATVEFTDRAQVDEFARAFAAPV
jgi:menaquinone-dependent protoporphyrinogen IX oxidase